MKVNYFRVIIVIAMIVMSAVLIAKSIETLVVFEISPNPMEHQTNIKLGFSERSIINVHIEDYSQIVVRNLYSGEAGKEINLEWDRLDNNGRYLPKGKYEVVVNYGGRYTSTKKTLILK